MRVGPGGPYALDYGAVIMMGAAIDADLDLLVDVIDAAEAAILAQFQRDDEGGDGNE